MKTLFSILVWVAAFLFPLTASAQTPKSVTLPAPGENTLA